MNIISNKTTLLEAIDNYDLLTPSYRIVLKVIIELSVDDETLINIQKLSEISGVSRPIVYQAIAVCEQKGFIERSKMDKSRISFFLIKRKKLNDIIKHYETRQLVQKKYLH